MNSSGKARRSDAGFTLTEVVIVTALLGLLMPVLAFAFSFVIRATPTNEDRADDSRSLLNLTNWLSQDVSSTSEDGFYIGTSAPAGGCLASSLPSGSVNLLELHWSEGTERFVTNYRWVSTSPTMGRIFRYACQQGQPAFELPMTAELNSVSTGPFAPAPVEIDPTPTVKSDGTPGTKGVEFVVIILDEYGVQRELLSLDATTTNVVTLLPGSSGPSAGNNTTPIAADLSMTITPPATQLESLDAVATDPDGDVLFTTFPNGLPPSWNIIATGVTLEVTPDPATPVGDYTIVYRVTDPLGASAEARLLVTIAEVTPNRPPLATAATIAASRSQPSVGTLVFSDPEGDPLTPVLEPADIPAGWSTSVSGNQVTVTPSATASGTTVIRYRVTDSLGATATSQITVNVCTVSLVSASPTTVVVTNRGDLSSDIRVEITSNGACRPLVLGFLPDEGTAVESTVGFDASNVATISQTTASAWTRPRPSSSRVVVLNVRQGANGPAELSIDLTTTR